MNLKILGIIIVLALAFRALFWLEVLGPAAPLRGDEIDYDAIARSLASGHGFSLIPDMPTAARPPLYPILLAGVYRIAGARADAGKILQILLGGAIVLLVYLLARRLFSETAALVAAAIVACNPSLIFISSYLLAENIYIVLLLSFLVLFAGGRTKPLSYAACAVGGILLGLASFARPNAFPFAIFAAGSFLLFGTGARGARLGKSIVMLAAAFAVLAPWAARNEARLGKPVLFTTHGGITFYQGNNRVACDVPTYRGTVAPLEALPGWDDIKAKGEIAGDAEAWRLGKAFIRENPDLVPRMAAWRFMRFWRLAGDAPYSGVKSGWWWDKSKRFGGLASSLDVVYIFSIVVIPLFIIGLVMTIRRARSLVYLYGMILVHTASAIVFFGSLRARMGIEPVIAVFAGSCAVRLLALARRRNDPTF
ncbi:MAG: glycosyltransferase family 39 protein [Candidatus Krumholzibacteria bacterium]|nr:glycosyltransferase family 39 protein [Candidatus Krumholzibacteria bacterium]